MISLRRVVVALALILVAGTAFAADISDVEKRADAFRDGIIAAAQGADPQLIGLRLSEATEAEQQGHWNEAAGKLKQAIGMGAEDAANWQKLSELEEKGGDLADAANAADLAARVQAGDARGKALLRVATLLDHAGSADEAVVAYEAALKLTWDSDANDRMEQLRQSQAFHAVNSRLETAGDTPRACIEFNAALQDPSAIRYQDYVRIEPQVDASYELGDGSSLCIGGLDFGTSYHVKLLPGLPSDDGQKLASGADLDFSVGDREPSIGFRDSAYVLPKVGSTGVPVITVNTDRVALRLMRINDRKLVDQVVDQRFLTNLAGYDAEQLIDRWGEEVWKGSMTVDNQRNKRVVTAFPIQDVVPETKPGIYVLMASRYTPGDQDQDQDYRWNPQATQWLVVSDLGLTTFSGADGLTVAVHSLETGDPMNRVDLKLIARDNEVLATATTDRTGIARFDPGLLRGEGGRTATAVMAFRKDGDFSFLDLTRGAFDLSDRGVGGRAMPGDTDLFFYS
ncbi:MAG TPA: hypothetical protein VHE77_07075, partial [Dongiaceae bacterium]|nr:hypothetical protein [Dongiaceae bacterium]